jgi:hypothetical protein
LKSCFGSCVYPRYSVSAIYEILVNDVNGRVRAFEVGHRDHSFSTLKASRTELKIRGRENVKMISPHSDIPQYDGHPGGFDDDVSNLGSHDSGLPLSVVIRPLSRLKPTLVLSCDIGFHISKRGLHFDQMAIRGASVARSLNVQSLVETRVL